MKKSLFILTVPFFMVGCILTSCQTPAQKEQKAKDKVEAAKSILGQAKSNLIEVQAEADADYQLFKKEAEEKLNAHQKSITEFKARIAAEKRENRAEYEKELAELEKKNSDLRMQLDQYKAEGKDKWEEFKAEFSRDMEKIGEAFKNLAVKNVEE
jgi:hypothetical protein